MWENNSRNIPLTIVATVCAASAVFTTVLRCYVRSHLVKSFGYDDWFMVAGLIVFMVYCVNVYLGVKFASGRHLWEISTDNARNGYLIWWFAYQAYGTAITIVRTSIGLFFLRITVKRYHRWFIYFIIFINWLTWTVFIGTVFFQCTPVSHYWNKAYPGNKGHCVPIKAFVSLGYLYGSVCAGCDLAFVLLPIHLIVWSTTLKRRTKLALTPLLAMAGLGGACPLVRMVYLRTFYSPDFFYQTIDIAIWSTLEPGIAITASNIATLRPLIRIFARSLTLRYYYSGSSNGSHTRPCKHSIREVVESIVVGLAFDEPADHQPPLPTLRLARKPAEGENRESTIALRDDSSSLAIRVRTDFSVMSSSASDQSLSPNPCSVWAHNRNRPCSYDRVGCSPSWWQGTEFRNPKAPNSLSTTSIWDGTGPDGLPQPAIVHFPTPPVAYTRSDPSRKQSVSRTGVDMYDAMPLSEFAR